MAAEGAGAMGDPVEETLALYRAMLLIRRFEEKTGQLYGMGLIGGFCHLYIGQEAVVTGLEACAHPGDHRVTSYRCHGHALAAGVSPEAVMSELLGRESGVNRGRGGSMHMFSPAHRFWGGHGIVGAQVPIGAGLALAEKHRGTNNIAFCYFGDGAADQGQVAETYAMARNWQLPVLFVIENNAQFAGAPVRGRAPALLERARAHGIPVQAVDGMDVRAVRAAGEDAVLHVRAGKGPYLLEVKTHRYRGHSMADPAKYRRAAETPRQREDRDPITSLRRQILAEDLASEDDLKAVDREIKEIVSAAAETARAAAEPDPATLSQHVYAEA
ncbi:pyruvate dehydrogenase (acetyl-transferring) E1 component subunit alpha [Roseivivax isoporae]|uniref:Pyruvate dehydrogenase E1 component subunit alpha n=1 Tax=Roseivivax isoporae LMG 25204 TaxID=1449351 RepID=X7F829_9RHOB|nr:pyruvate dehydrogenase (acetyl-transferring) E1 component subunit alpha [Roseivivax isoporae]ETX28256.1 pyruvate dehydrogenase E1 subunit alpha [Roseivivax isoporae LMG 25204]